MPLFLDTTLFPAATTNAFLEATGNRAASKIKSCTVKLEFLNNFGWRNDQN